MQAHRLYMPTLEGVGSLHTQCAPPGARWLVRGSHLKLVAFIGAHTQTKLMGHTLKQRWLLRGSHLTL